MFMCSPCPISGASGAVVDLFSSRFAVLRNLPLCLVYELCYFYFARAHLCALELVLAGPYAIGRIEHLEARFESDVAAVVYEARSLNNRCRPHEVRVLVEYR